VLYHLNHAPFCFSYFFGENLTFFGWYHPQTTILLLMPPDSWDYRCFLPHLNCWLRWRLTNFLPGLASNFILLICASQVPGTVGMHQHTWLKHPLSNILFILSLSLSLSLCLFVKY
jgi:hypothetical protein